VERADKEARRAAEMAVKSSKNKESSFSATRMHANIRLI
jgi:hypothetical protein